MNMYLKLHSKYCKDSDLGTHCSSNQMCVRTSAEEEDFQKKTWGGGAGEGGGGLMILLNLRSFRFCFVNYNIISIQFGFARY